jgi:hypothetical protein
MTEIIEFISSNLIDIAFLILLASLIIFIIVDFIRLSIPYYFPKKNKKQTTKTISSSDNLPSSNSKFKNDSLNPKPDKSVKIPDKQDKPKDLLVDNTPHHEIENTPPNKDLNQLPNTNKEQPSNKENPKTNKDPQPVKQEVFLAPESKRIPKEEGTKVYATGNDKNDLPKSAEDNSKYLSPPNYRNLFETFQRHEKAAQHKPSIKPAHGSRVSNFEQKPTISAEKAIYSQANPKQTDDLRINFSPNNLFLQPDPYSYPVVKMPDNNSFLKLPRLGRSDNRGYKEHDFFTLLRNEIRSIEVKNNFHLPIPSFSRPYEPDIVLYDESLNLYIDIEIDEPYDGYYRYPTHTIESKDNIRDLFFTQSGWIVIRFTEKQVHEQSSACLKYILKVLESINGIVETESLEIITEPQWDFNQCIRWASDNYRETYLGIRSFTKKSSKTRIVVNDVNDKTDPIELKIIRPTIYKNDINDTNVAFDDEKHAYFPISNPTGNAEYISVTSLIERFFPFDIERYILKKMEKENKTRDEVLAEYMESTEKSSSKGTYLHEQIENFLKGQSYDDKLIEFKYFKNFYETEIKPRGFIFKEAEKIIVANDFGIAGTVDAIFKKPDKNEYVMLDWKRSKKVSIDGHPKKYGYGFAIADLSHLDNSSWYKYSLQQNLYKFILETYYGINVSSMRLVVLHENYKNYIPLKVNDMHKEVAIILRSINHKI